MVRTKQKRKPAAIPMLLRAASVAILSVVSFACLGCGPSKEVQNEITALKETNKNLAKENEGLKARINKLNDELEEIKKTPGFVYQEGVDYLTTRSYYDAATKFREVLDKYPDNEFTPKARTKLSEANREIARLEAERKKAEREAEEARKYQPRTEGEAIAEWLDFRNNEKDRIGTVTTWRFKVDYISAGSESPLGSLSDDYRSSGHDKKVVVLGPLGWTYLAASAVGKVPIVREDDWITVTGRFEGVSSDGVVELTALRVVNEGYR